jgi:hypothetical protein
MEPPDYLSQDKLGLPPFHPTSGFMISTLYIIIALRQGRNKETLSSAAGAFSGVLGVKDGLKIGVVVGEVSLEVG